MTLYLLNSPVLTDYGLWRYSGPLDPGQARKIAASGFVSAVGHPGAAELLQEILRQKVDASRRRVNIAPGETALVLRVKTRLPEGAVLDKATLSDLDWELSLLERVE